MQVVSLYTLRKNVNVLPFDIFKNKDILKKYGETSHFLEELAVTSLALNEIIL